MTWLRLYRSSADQIDLRLCPLHIWVARWWRMAPSPPSLPEKRFAPALRERDAVTRIEFGINNRRWSVWLTAPTPGWRPWGR